MYYLNYLKLICSDIYVLALQALPDFLLCLLSSLYLVTYWLTCLLSWNIPKLTLIKKCNFVLFVKKIHYRLLPTIHSANGLKKSSEHNPLRFPQCNARWLNELSPCSSGYIGKMFVMGFLLVWDFWGVTLSDSSLRVGARAIQCQYIVSLRSVLIKIVSAIFLVKVQIHLFCVNESKKVISGWMFFH